MMREPGILATVSISRRISTIRYGDVPGSIGVLDSSDQFMPIGEAHCLTWDGRGWRCGRYGSARKRFLADGSSSIGSFGQRSRVRRDVSCKGPIIHALIDRWFASISSPFQAGVSGKDFASNLFSFRL
jgi:hypothetical protein